MTPNEAAPQGDAAAIAQKLAELGGTDVSALSRPLRPGERPEERLLSLGLLSDRDLALQLAERSGFDMVGLRGLELDPRLFHYVPLDVCERELIVPVAVDADRLTVATAFLDPDLGLVSERFPRLPVDLVIAPHGEVVEALRLAAGVLVPEVAG